MPRAYSSGPVRSDVTGWFQNQLGIIGRFRTQLRWRDSSLLPRLYQPLTHYSSNSGVCSKFGKAKLTAPACPTSNCKESVTLCGTCIDVTELGNIALAYGVPMSTPNLAKIGFNPVGITLWGGFWIEVQGGGEVAGFDKGSDIYGGETRRE